MNPSHPGKPGTALNRGAATMPAISLPPGPPAVVSAAPATPPAPPGQAAPTVGALVQALRRRLALGLCVAALAAVLGVVATYVVFPPKYVAQTRLELNSRPNKPVLSNAIDPETDPAIFRANQKAILVSPLVLSSALNALNEGKYKGSPITGQSPEALETALKIDFSQGPEIMQVKLLGARPEHLADLLNAIVAAYTEELDRRDRGRKDVLIAELEKQKAKYQEQLDKKRAELRQLEKDKKIADPQSLQVDYNAAVFKLQGVQKSLGDTKDELSTKELLATAKKARLEKIDVIPIPQVYLQKALAERMQATGYPTLIAQQDVLIAQMMTYPKSDTRESELDKLKFQKKQLIDQLHAVEKTLQPELEKLLKAEASVALAAEIEQLETNISLLRTREERLRGEMNQVNEEVRRLNPINNRAAVPVEKLRDDVEQLNDVVKNLAREVALRKAEPTMGSRIVVLQPAETPTDKDYSRFTKLAGGAGLGLFVLGLFGVGFWEFRTRKVSGVEEVTKGLGLGLVGTMPRLPARARRPLPGQQSPKDLYWQSLITESVDAIRTQLLHLARADGLHVVMVTSAGGGEGKTSLASQLAASLARAWRKTLLVDGDLRNPAAHKLFDLPLEPGLSEVLRGEANVADVIKPTLLSRLWLMPAGHWDAHAVQALAQDGVSQTFAGLKEQYDFIIVDSCPVLPVADALLLAQHVDGVIFSVLRDVSRLPAVQLAQQRLQGLGVRTLGAVVIGADDDVQGLGFRYAVQAGS
jgi:capsular exopolysaccharide synthesis family protein